MENINNKIKNFIHEILNHNNIGIHNIILFGSRARGDNSNDSDYDILVIIKGDIERFLKYKLSSEINKKLAKYFVENDILTGIDLIIKSENEVEYLKDKIGSVTGEAIREGIVL